MSKRRLFEIFERVNKIDEGLLEAKQKEGIVNEFVGFVENHLQMGDNKPNVVISNDDGEAANMFSFGKFTPESKEIRVVGKNRNLADILRTLAHEMVHFKQLSDGKLNADSNEDGSEAENEANATAAVIMREFGKANPIIFE